MTHLGPTPLGPAPVTLWAGATPLRIDYAARSVYVDDAEIALTPTEFDVLACLAERAGTVVSAPEIIARVWGEWFGPTDHVFVHVHHIRRKLGPCGRLIVTKRKAGYLLRVEEPPSSEAIPWTRMSQEYLDLLQEDARARGVIWLIIDQGRKVTWVSDSITDLLGWAPADLVGQYPWTVALTEEIETFAQRFPMSGGASLLTFDTRLCRPDGSAVPISVSAQVLQGVDGRRLGGIGEWSPASPDASLPGERAMPFRLHYDADHVLTAVELHQPFLGWDPDEVIGTEFSLAGLDVESTRRLMAGLATAGPDHALGASAVRGADGETRLVDITLRLGLADGEVTGYTGEVRVLD